MDGKRPIAAETEKGDHLWQTSTTGTVTAGPTERVSPNPKREARAKAAERHVATVSEACAKDIERSLAGVCEFDGMLPVLSRR